jgi:hypothetical protein
MKLLISFVAMTALIGASLWTIIYPIGPHRFSRALAKLALVLGLIILIMGWLSSPVAVAKVEWATLGIGSSII